MKVLVLDAHLGERCDHAEALVGKGRRVSRSTRISEDDFCELLAMDYGDEASAEVVRDALRYRAENPRCRVAVVRVLDAHWSEAECRARINSMPQVGQPGLGMTASKLSAVMERSDQLSVRIDADAVLFEYAA